MTGVRSACLSVGAAWSVVVAACSPTLSPAASPASASTPLIGGRSVVLPADATLGPPVVEVACAVGQFCPRVPLYTLRRGTAELTLSAPTGTLLRQTWPPGQQAAFDALKQQLPPSVEPPPLPHGLPPSAPPAALMSSPRLVVQGTSSIRPVGPYSYEFRWAALDGSGGWSRSTESDTPNALASIRSGPPVHALVGAELDFTLDLPPTGLELLAWRTADPVPSPLGSASKQTVLNGAVVYEVRATWDYGPGGRGKAAYLVQIGGD
jgi:hypothetical protein